MAQDVIPDRVYTMIPRINRLVYIVPILILVPYIITQLFHDVVRTLRYKQLIFLDFIYTGNHRPMVFIYRVYVHATIPYLLNQTWVCAISVHLQVPRLELLRYLVREHSGFIEQFIHIQPVVYDSALPRSRRCAEWHNEQ